jgi:hypothetical protein
MDVSDIISEFGSYYKNNGQNLKDLYHVLYAQTDTTKYMSTRITNGTQYEVGKAELGQVLQPFHKNWTPTDGPDFTGKKIQLYKFKFDLTEAPADLEATWLGFLYDNKMTVDQMPFVKWYVEKVLAKAARDYEKSEIIKGVYAAPNGSTPGALGTAMNGLNKVIADAITATEMTAITTGALETVPEDFCTQIEDFADGIIGINEDYADVPMNIYMSKALAQRYARGFRAKYGKDTDFNAAMSGTRIDTEFKIVGLSSMANLTRIFATTTENMLDLKWGANMGDVVNIEKAKRSVNIYGDWWRGAGFIDNSVVFPNEAP